MDAELEKLVEAGKLTTKSAGQLEKLKPVHFACTKVGGSVASAMEPVAKSDRHRFRN